MADDPTTSHPVTPAPQPAAPPPRPGSTRPRPPHRTWSGAADGPDPARPAGRAPAKPKPRSSSGRWLNVLLGVAARSPSAASPSRSAARPPRPRRQPVAAATSAATSSAAATARPERFVPAGSGGGLFGAGGLTVEGTVTSVTSDTLTLTTADGRTIEVKLGADTDYHQQAAGSASDVTTGSKVSVQLDLAGRARRQRRPGQRRRERADRDRVGRDGHPVGMKG